MAHTSSDFTWHTHTQPRVSPLRSTEHKAQARGANEEKRYNKLSNKYQFSLRKHKFRIHNNILLFSPHIFISARCFFFSSSLALRFPVSCFGMTGWVHQVLWVSLQTELGTMRCASVWVSVYMCVCICWWWINANMLGTMTTNSICVQKNKYLRGTIRIEEFWSRIWSMPEVCERRKEKKSADAN